MAAAVATALAAAVAGCASQPPDMTPASPERCLAACEHASKMDLQLRLDKASKARPEARPQLVEVAKAATQRLTEKCATQCRQTGTRAQVTCILGADDLDELRPCTKLPKRQRPAPQRVPEKTD